MIAVLLAAVVSIGVAEREWRIHAYRTTVHPGRISFEIHNYGEDVHNLALRGPRGYRSATSADIEPEASGRLRVTLRRRGTYTLLCLKPGHIAKGMRSTIVVR